MTFQETMKLTFEEQAEKANYPTCGMAWKGYQAFHSGETLDECPHNGSGCWREYRWKVGWFIAKRKGIIPQTIEELDEKYHRMYFNTGVTPYGHVPPIKLGYYDCWSSNNVKQVMYWIKHPPPEGFVVIHLASHPHVLDSIPKSGMAIPIMGGGMVSDYAVFRRVGKQDA